MQNKNMQACSQEQQLLQRIQATQASEKNSCQRGSKAILAEDGCSTNHEWPRAPANWQRSMVLETGRQVNMLMQSCRDTYTCRTEKNKQARVRLASKLPTVTQSKRASPSGRTTERCACEWQQSLNELQTGANRTRDPGCRRSSTVIANLKCETLR